MRGKERSPDTENGAYNKTVFSINTVIICRSGSGSESCVKLEARKFLRIGLETGAGTTPCGLTGYELK